MTGRRPHPVLVDAAYALLALGSVALVFPLWWMISVSLAPPEESARIVSSFEAETLLPLNPHISNYGEALKGMGNASAADADAGDAATRGAGGNFSGFKDALANSIVITSACAAGTVLSCSLVGYAFARLRFRGKGPMFLLMLSTMMLPAQVTMIPLFLLFRSLGWIDTLLPLIVPAFFGAAFFIFMFRQFFAGVPEELLEAARIDGSGELGIWWRIMLPLCRPVVAVTAIFTFIWTWNDFMNPLIYLNSPDTFTLALALNSFKSQFGGVDRVHLMMAAAVVTMIPCIVLFLAAQRHFVGGLTVGGVKG